MQKQGSTPSLVIWRAIGGPPRQLAFYTSLWFPGEPATCVQVGIKEASFGKRAPQEKRGTVFSEG